MNKINILNYADSNHQYDEGITLSAVFCDSEVFFNVTENETGNEIFLTIYQMETMLSLAKEMKENIINNSN